MLHLGHPSVGEMVEHQGLLLAHSMLQVLSLVNATSTDGGYAHAIADEDDDVAGLLLVGILLHPLSLLDRLLQLLETHFVPKFRI